jgi:hypothetical protein
VLVGQLETSLLYLISMNGFLKVTCKLYNLPDFVSSFCPLKQSAVYLLGQEDLSFSFKAELLKAM